MNGELYINGRLIDINQAVPFPFTYNISDAKDLSSRKGNKSKTITLPGTANNCALMATVYLTTSREKYQPPRNRSSWILIQPLNQHANIMRMACLYLKGLRNYYNVNAAMELGVLRFQ